ncbi:hypothetical protein ACS0TY_025725 [Phlomoides rotata]
MEGVFVSSGDNPFELIKDSIKILANHRGTFSHLENKKVPAQYLGVCSDNLLYLLYAHSLKYVYGLLISGLRE